MSNRIKKMEQIIDEMEDYLSGCKFRAFSSTEIIVNKEDMETFLVTLRHNVPDEVKQYQKIIANKEAILADAATRADTMKAEAEQQARDLLNQAAAEHNQMISEHEIMLRAQARADEFVNMAMNKAQGIVDNATMESNALKDAANQYMEEVLTHLAKIIASAQESFVGNFNRCLRDSEESYQKLYSSLDEYHRLISGNIQQLHPVEETALAEEQEIPAEE